jgi:hypothetical protein
VSVDTEWSKDHMLVIGPYTLILLEVYVGMVNWRPGGAIGGKWRPSVGKVGECDAACRHLQDCSSRLCRLGTHEQVLNILIACYCLLA